MVYFSESFLKKEDEVKFRGRAKIGIFFRIVFKKRRRIYIANNGNLCNSSKDVKPHSQILSSLGDWSSSFAHKFITVDPNFKDVVCQCEKRCQGKGCHEDCDETELNNCKIRKDRYYHIRRFYFPSIDLRNSEFEATSSQRIKEWKNYKPISRYSANNPSFSTSS